MDMFCCFFCLWCRVGLPTLQSYSVEQADEVMFEQCGALRSLSTYTPFKSARIPYSTLLATSND